MRTKYYSISIVITKTMMKMIMKNPISSQLLRASRTYKREPLFNTSRLFPVYPFFNLNFSVSVHTTKDNYDYSLRIFLSRLFF